MSIFLTICLRIICLKLDGFCKKKGVLKMPNFCIDGVLFETSGNGLLQKISLHHLCDTIEIPCATPYGETISSIGRDFF